MPSALDKAQVAVKLAALEKLASMETTIDGKLSSKELRAEIKATAASITVKPDCKASIPLPNNDEIKKKTADVTQEILANYKALLGSDLAKIIFPNGIVEVTAKDIQPLVRSRMDLELKKACQVRT